jgi:hypothetical protein
MIHWEKYRAKRPIQQCFNCQKFGHSSAFCGRPANCVKCDQPHQTQSCPKLPSEPPSCVNCGGAHPANYSGCPVYKKILESRTRKQPPPHYRPPQQSPSRSHSPPGSIPETTFFSSHLGPSGGPKCCLPTRDISSFPTRFIKIYLSLCQFSNGWRCFMDISHAPTGREKPT